MSEFSAVKVQTENSKQPSKNVHILEGRLAQNKLQRDEIAWMKNLFIIILWMCCNFAGKCYCIIIIYYFAFLLAVVTHELPRGGTIKFLLLLLLLKSSQHY